MVNFNRLEHKNVTEKYEFVLFASLGNIYKTSSAIQDSRESGVFHVAKSSTISIFRNKIYA